MLIWFWFGFVVRGESPGCRLISTASMFEWLRNLLHPLTGEQYGKMEPKHPECLTSPFILNNSVETANADLFPLRRYMHVIYTALHDEHIS